MAKHKEEKTNVMRTLDQKKIPYTAHTYEEFKELADTKPGFIKMMWCGDEACEIKVKEDTTCTSRCMPFAQEQIGEVCPVCGKPAKAMVYWGKAY